MKITSFSQLRLIYQYCLRNDNTIPLNSNDLKIAFSKAIKIIDQNKIIKQQTINYKQQNFINSINLSKNGQQYNKEKILSLLSKKFQYYRNIKTSNNILPFYIYKIDFKNQKQIYQLFDRFINQDNKEIKQQNVRFFIDNFSNCNGLLLPFINNLVFFLLNKNNYSDITIMHQFTHYLQLILDVQISQKIDFTNQQLNKIKYLGINQNYLNYLFNQKQFIPHINDCCTVLKEIYLKEFSNNFTKKQFINYLIQYAKNLNNTFNIHHIFNIYLYYNKDISNFYTFIISIYLHKNQKLVIKILNNTFNI